MTRDVESIVDKRIEQTVEFSERSDLGLKLACIAVSSIVGKYSDATQQIATRRKRSVSSVENWAHAYWLRKSLAPIDPRLVRHLWRELTPTHWWRAYDVIHTAGYDALPHLQNAADYEWSVGGMLAEFDKEREAGTAPLRMSHALHSLFGLASELRKIGVSKEQAVKIVTSAYEESE